MIDPVPEQGQVSQQDAKECVETPIAKLLGGNADVKAFTLRSARALRGHHRAPS
jgi:hypothetical protein